MKKDHDTLSRTHRPLSRWLAAVVLGFIAPAALVGVSYGVEQTGDIIGAVADDKGASLPGATITLSGENLQGERAVRSGAEGGYAFRALPPGKYTLRFVLDGYQTSEIDSVVVNVGRTTSIPITLAQGQLTERVEVTGKAPLVDTQRTQTQDNYTAEYLEKTPIGSGARDYLGVIQSSAGTGPGDGANPTVRGSTIGGNVYLVDGVDSTDPVTGTFGSNFIFDAIEEVQFQTGGFAAEFGRATGGVVNVVTKSGGNIFSGTVDLRYNNEKFFTKGKDFDPDELDLTNQQLEATFGGPIVKDKLWFFLAGSYLNGEAGTSGSAAVRDFEGIYYLGKLSWQLSPNHRLIGQITADPAEIDNADLGGAVKDEALSRQTQGSKFVTLQYQGTLTSNLLLHGQVARYKSQLDSEPQSGNLGLAGFVDYRTLTTYRNATDAQYSDRSLDQANATMTWHVDRLAGSHTFKGGVDLQKRKFRIEQFLPGGETFTICSRLFDTTSPCAAPTILDHTVDRPVGALRNKGLVTATFLQDDWRVHPNVTLNVGARYETFGYDDDRGHRVLKADIVQPRVGAAWDATGDSRNVFKVYVGRFADTAILATPTIVNSRARAQDLFINEEIAGLYFVDPDDDSSFDANGDGTIEQDAYFTTFGGPGGSVFANGGDLTMTNVWEASVSYERQFSAVTAGSITLVRRTTHDIIEDVFDQGAGVYVIDNVPELRRRYEGAELRFRTKWKKLSVWSSYTLSRSLGNIEYTLSLGTDYDFPDLAVNRYGYLSDDSRHALRAHGYWELPLGFEVGFSGVFFSGFPRNLVAAAFPYGDRFLESRGSRRLPSVSQFDLDLRKGFTIGKTDLQAIVSILNLFDTQHITATNPATDDPLTYQLSRRYEVGARLRF